MEPRPRARTLLRAAGAVVVGVGGNRVATNGVAEELARIADTQQGNAVSGTVVVDFDQRQIAAAG